MGSTSEFDMLHRVLVHVGPFGITASTLILLGVLVALVALFAFVAGRAYRAFLRYRFYEDYQVSLERSTAIHRRKGSGSNCYSLAYPKWLHHNKDGSRDRRRATNHIVRKPCVLLVDGYRVVCCSPMHLVWLVNTLRDKGVAIDRCREEELKFQLLTKNNELLQKREDILSLVQRFREKPTDFENYCARLFELRGFKALVTPPSRDGGYDIGLWTNAGLVGVAECKCYDPDNKIGRDMVQKLVGANATIHATSMYFVTTSDFSYDAREYAKCVGVELIDGSDLLRMAGEAVASKGFSMMLTADDYKLRREDILRYYPPDYPPERFEV